MPRLCSFHIRSALVTISPYTHQNFSTHTHTTATHSMRNLSFLSSAAAVSGGRSIFSGAASACVRRQHQPLATGFSSSSSSLMLLSAQPLLVGASRHISSFGRITDEDRRWWLIHLECCPDVTPGTFISWLDNCGTHTTKKLIERNVWTVEQVANLSSDQIDELRYKEGCLHMDVVWEHARTVLVPLKSRTAGMSAEASTLHDRILELRKKRELERRRQQILTERRDTVESREESLRALRDAVEKKRAALRARMQSRQQEQEEEDDDDEDGNDNASEVVDKMSGGGSR